MQVVYNANKLAKLVKEKKGKQNWLDYYQLKYSRNQSKRPMMKVLFFNAVSFKCLISHTLHWHKFSSTGVPLFFRYCDSTSHL